MARRFDAYTLTTISVACLAGYVLLAFMALSMPAIRNVVPGWKILPPEQQLDGYPLAVVDRGAASVSMSVSQEYTAALRQVCDAYGLEWRREDQKDVAESVIRARSKLVDSGITSANCAQLLGSLRALSVPGDLPWTERLDEYVRVRMSGSTDEAAIAAVHALARPASLK